MKRKRAQSKLRSPEAEMRDLQRYLAMNAAHRVVTGIDKKTGREEKAICPVFSLDMVRRYLKVRAIYRDHRAPRDGELCAGVVVSGGLAR